MNAAQLYPVSTDTKTLELTKKRDKHVLQLTPTAAVTSFTSR